MLASSISFDNCIWRHKIFSLIQNVPSCIFLVNPHTHSSTTYCSAFYHCRLVLSILVFIVNGVIQYVLFCVLFLSLSIIFLRFIHECFSSSYFFLFMSSIQSLNVPQFLKTPFSCWCIFGLFPVFGYYE